MAPERSDESGDDPLLIRFMIDLPVDRK